MPMTLVEIKKTVQDPLKAGIIETLYLEEPFFQYIPFETIPGLSYSYNSEQALPGVAFRKLNAAYSETVGVVQKDVEVLKPFGGDSDCDVAFVEAYGPGRRAAYDAMFTKAMGIKYLQTFLYGNSPSGRAGAAYTDADGFDGLQARLTGNQLVDCGGSTGTDGSSVFAIKFGDGNVTGLQTGSGLDARDLGELQTKPAYRTRIEHIAGMAVEQGRAAAWLYDCTVASGPTVALMDQLVDQVAGSPDVILMSKRSRRQLKTQCLTYGIIMPTVLGAIGQPVLSWDGIPILVSDAIIDTETVP